jgi:hypothetical protein
MGGPDVVVKAIVAQVGGYTKRFTLGTWATELTGSQVVELFGARFRQEDDFRDLKQALGCENWRPWTENPIARTTQTRFVTVLRLLHFRLQAAEGGWRMAAPAVQPAQAAA